MAIQIRRVSGNVMLDTVNNKQVILTASEYIPPTPPPSLQLNFTGGTYFLTSEYSGKTITTNNATNTNVFVLPDGAATTFTLSISGNTADQPVSVIYGTGDTINTLYSKNYIYGSGETIAVSCASAGVWKFGTVAETVYRRFVTSSLSTTQKDICGIGVGSVGSYTDNALSLSGKWALCPKSGATPTTLSPGGLALSVDYMNNWKFITGTTNDNFYYYVKYLSSNGKYSLIWSIPDGGSTGDGYIQVSKDYCDTWTTKIYTGSLTRNHGYNSANGGGFSLDGKYWAHLSSGNTILYSDDYLETFNSMTISGAGTILQITMNASGKIWYAVENAKIWRSMDYGSNWTDITSSGTIYTSVKCSASGQWVVIGKKDYPTSKTSQYSSNYGISFTNFTADWTPSVVISHSGKYWGTHGDGSTSAQSSTIDFGSSFSYTPVGNFYDMRGCPYSINADGSYGLCWANFTSTIRKEKQGGW